MRFEVAVEDTVLVAKGQTAKELMEERLDHSHVQVNTAAVQVLLQVLMRRRAWIRKGELSDRGCDTG